MTLEISELLTRIFSKSWDTGKRSRGWEELSVLLCMGAGVTDLISLRGRRTTDAALNRSSKGDAQLCENWCGPVSFIVLCKAMYLVHAVALS